MEKEGWQEAGRRKGMKGEEDVREERENTKEKEGLKEGRKDKGKEVQMRPYPPQMSGRL
jgi:hypothetical protein